MSCGPSPSVCSSLAFFEFIYFWSSAFCNGPFCFWPQESKRSSWRIAFGNTSEPWTRAWSVCSTEKLKNAHCWCCSVNHIDPQRVLCDRLIVRKCVICWFGTEEHFNELVRSSVALQQLGSDAFPYFAMLGATTPILSAFMDSVASLLRVDNEETREVVFSIFIIRYLTYWLWGVPCT